ncbi:hypothetical protein D3C71_2003100 [compost metagenome]
MAEELSERFKQKRMPRHPFLLPAKGPLPAAKAFNVQTWVHTALVMPAGTERACSSACVWLEVGMGRG